MQGVRFSWFNDETWPFDSPTHTFLGRALDRVGRMEFGKQWTGFEVNRIPKAGWFPDTFHRTTRTQQIEAFRVLQVCRRGLVAFPSDLAAHWPEALAARDEFNVAVAAMAERLLHVRSVMREHLSFGRLTAVAVSMEDGEPKGEIPSNAWNTHKHSQWFDAGKVSRWDAFGAAGDHPLSQGDRLFYWLYIDHDGLNELDKAPDAPAIDTDLHLPPHLRVLISSIPEIYKEPGSRPTKDELRSHLEAVAARVGLRTIDPAFFGHVLAIVGMDSDAMVVPRSKDFKKRIQEEIAKSPTRRTMTANDIIRLGETEYSLTKNQAKIIRSTVIEALNDEASKAAWRKTGPITLSASEG